MASVVWVLLILFDLFMPHSLGRTSEVCISKGGRFPPFSSEGKPPKRVNRGSKDLTLCRVFRKKTCCDATQTHPALLSVRKLASTGEASQECLHLWELLECSICDPRVGVRPGPPLISSSLCNRVFEACSGAYFAMDPKTQVLKPCGVNDFICGRASELVPNGTELCHAAGFTVKSAEDVYGGTEGAFFFDEKSSLDFISGSWAASESAATPKSDPTRVIEDFQKRLRDLPFREHVSWAVGGLVLTAGLVFISKRKSYGQRQKLAAIRRTAKRLETKIGQQSPTARGNRNVSRKK